MRKLFYFFLVLISGLAVSCSKDKKEDPTTGSTLDLVKDSVFLYSKEAYYWYDGLPDYKTFNPRGVTGSDDISTLTNEVDKISQYKINPATMLPYEYYSTSPGEAKYSYIDDGSSNSALNGNKSDFGFALLYNNTNDLRIKYVYAGSSAGLAGVKRGYQILAINGNSNLSYDGSSGAHVQFVLNAWLYGNTISMTLKKPDNSTINVNLTRAAYIVDPVITYKVIDQGGGKKVGYVVFNSFTSDAVADPKLNAAFNYFTSNGITDLVVDLRYNGGGYVSTAEYLTNLIVPAAKSGTRMYSTYFNDKLVAGNTPLLANQVRVDPNNGQRYNYAQFDYTVAGNAVNFAKIGSLNVNRVFFIVTGSTASASELTINNLLPVMDVKVIGTTSYGKPVGFFDIKINKYDLYIAEFATKNSLGQGEYYAGMTPGSVAFPGKMDNDDLTKDFGDPTEGLLAHALNYVKTGVYNIPAQQVQSASGGLKTFSMAQSASVALEMDQGQFSGMIYNKSFKLKGK